MPRHRKSAPSHPPKHRRSAPQSEWKSAMRIGDELSHALGVNVKPTAIPGGYRWSDTNESVQFTTFSPEYSQKVVIVVSVFKDGTATLAFFSDEGLSETNRYENITHFLYQGGPGEIASMKQDVEWVWKTVDGYAASHQGDQPELDEAKRPRGDAELRLALTNLLEFVTSGRRYKSQNPYTIPEVQASFKALGIDWRNK